MMNFDCDEYECDALGPGGFLDCSCSSCKVEQKEWKKMVKRKPKKEKTEEQINNDFFKQITERE